MGKDYYNILGVDKGASQDEIKKAFRKKAHEHHPDKAHGDEAKFKEVNEAYQVLGNEKKRAQYDQFGSAFGNAQAGGGFSGFEGFRDFSGFSDGVNINMEDLGDIFGGIGDIFGFSGRGGGKRRSARGNDLQVSIAIDFKEAVFGAEKEIRLNKKIRCDRCGGGGAEPGHSFENCKTCGGTGRTVRMQRTILGNMQVQAACSDCSGEGRVPGKKCSKCGGSGATKDEARLKIKIPAGVDNGSVIRLSGQGEAGEKGAAAGDLYVNMKVNEDKRFKREGDDIHTESQISFTQAVLGDKIEVETVDGPVTMKIPEGMQSGTVFRLRGRGVNRLHGRGRGDQLVKVKILTPKSLSRKQKQLIKELNI